MEHLQYAEWLAGQTIDVLLDLWPITLMFGVGFVILLFIKSPFFGAKSSYQPRYMLVFSPLVVSLLIFIWGAVMEHTTTSPSIVQNWEKETVTALFFFQMLLSLVIIWKMKGYRWFAAVTVTLEQGVGAACAFIASMSVGGKWL